MSERVSLQEKVLNKKDLTLEDARQLLHDLLMKNWTDDALARLLRALSEKGETAQEIAGFALGMREAATPFHHSHLIVADTAGTGGDGKGTFNISTLAALVIAGAGVAVAKHGNRGVSSRCGSADVLAALGVQIECAVERSEKCFKEEGIAFLFAPLYHRATAQVARVRRQLSGRTIFNWLGPLTNPARANRQIMGVFDFSRAEVIAEVLAMLGTEKAWIVSAQDGSDEISLTSTTRVLAFERGQKRTFSFDPRDYGFAFCAEEDLQGGSAEDAVRIARAILEGNDAGPRRDVVLLNAAAGILLADRASGFQEALKVARESLDSGAAFAKLQALVNYSQGEAAS